MVSLIRSSTDTNGQKMFTPEEYLTKEQIVSQFCQLTLKKKRGEKLEAVTAEDEVENDEDSVLAEVQVDRISCISELEKLDQTTFIMFYKNTCFKT